MHTPCQGEGPEALGELGDYMEKVKEEDSLVMRIQKQQEHIRVCLFTRAGPGDQEKGRYRNAWQKRQVFLRKTQFLNKLAQRVS